MAKRVADGKRIYNEPWNNRVRSVFFWLLLEGADGLGIQQERPAAIAEALSDEEWRLTVGRAVDAIDRLCAGNKPCLIRYEHEGRVFLVFRKFNDQQLIRYDVEPTCPMPPAEIMGKLGAKQRAHLLRNYARHYGVTTEELRATLSLSPPPSLTPNKTTAKTARAGAEAPPREPDRCGWCENPKPATAAPTDRLLQAYHDAYRKQHDTCPMMTPGRDGKALKNALRAGKDEERITAVIEHGLRSEDSFLLKQGFKLTTILSNFDGIALALDGGFMHGNPRAKTRGVSAARGWKGNGQHG